MTKNRVLRCQISKEEMHVGYRLSCYSPTGYFFGVPLFLTRGEARNVLKREAPISGEPLTFSQLKALQAHLVPNVEIAWHDDFEYYLEGENLPDNADEWM